jgi:vacuolar protein sorting-associated protein 13A/C
MSRKTCNEVMRRWYKDDIWCAHAAARLVLKGDTVEMSANALGLSMESNGIRILEPFDTSIMYSNASGKTNIHLSVSDIFMSFSFSILRLFLAVEEDFLAFLRMTSKKMTVVCSQFDKVGTIKCTSTCS